MGDSEGNSWGQQHRPHLDDGRRWRPMPCLWWPWLCQLLAVEDHHGAVDIELLVLEACRVQGRTVGPGTLFPSATIASAAPSSTLSPPGPSAGRS
jgi:hypothetical protein